MRTLLGAVLAAGLIGTLLATGPQASAASPSTSGAAITAIYFDSPGSDRGGNTSLNAEWVQIKNVTRSTKTLTHWTIRDASRHTYTFPTFTLRAGATVKVHTGSGTKSSSNLYWGQRWYIWNNTGDTAYLRNASGKTVDTCAYTKKDKPPQKRC